MRGCIRLLGAVSLVFTIITYILKSIGLRRVADRKKLKWSFRAWIPILDLSLFGEIIGSMYVGRLELFNLKYVIPAVMVIYVVLANIPYVGYVLGALVFVFMLIAKYNYIKNLTEKYLLLTGVSLLPGAFPIILYLIRDNEFISDN